MTRRERLEMVIRGEITPELIADCKVELEKLNERSDAALQKSRETETYKENREVERRVLEVLSEEPLLIDELMEKLEWEGSRQRLSVVCAGMVKRGLIRDIELKVKGKGKRKGYMI